MRVYPLIFCLALALPGFAAGPPNGKNDWGRIARFAGDQTVRISLRDGREIKGSILEFRSDGLTFIEERRLTRIDLRRVVGASLSEAGRLRAIEGRPYLKGQRVELRLRDGHLITGVVRSVDHGANQLQVAESSAAENIARVDVKRVTRKSGWKSALIGGVAGAALLGGLTARDNSDLGNGNEFALGAVVGGSVGAGIGALIGWRTLIYEAPPD